MKRIKSYWLQFRDTHGLCVRVTKKEFRRMKSATEDSLAVTAQIEDSGYDVFLVIATRVEIAIERAGGVI